MTIYIQLIWSYLKIGLFGFGGGYAMLALIENEIVGAGWISEQMFTDIVAISQMTPGPIGINSVYKAWSELSILHQVPLPHHKYRIRPM